MTKRKEITRATLKALFAKSGNLCAYPRCSQPLVDEDNVFVGEVAHIHAVNKEEARFNPSLNADDLRSYDNLLILCHPHHKRIDTRAENYPPDRLRKMRKEHEATVQGVVFKPPSVVIEQSIESLEAQELRATLRRYPEMLDLIEALDGTIGTDARHYYLEENPFKRHTARILTDTVLRICWLALHCRREDLGDFELMDLEFLCFRRIEERGKGTHYLSRSPRDLAERMLDRLPRREGRRHPW